MRRLVDFFFDRRIIGLTLLFGIAGVALAERMVVTLPMAYFITFAVIAFSVVLTGRIKTSIYFGLAVVALIAFVSYAKIKWMSVAPNIVDIYYFAFNPGTLAFLLDGFLPLVVGVIVLFLGALAALFVFGWYETPSSKSRWRALIAFPLCVALAIAFQPRSFSGVEDLMSFRYITSVFTSMKHLANLRDPIPLLELLDREVASLDGDVETHGVCKQLVSKPDIVVVQAESIVPPEIFYDGEIPKELEGAFNGPDETLRPLKVETFSGGTWITTAGFVSGLPIADLGWLTSYSNFILEGRIRQSLVQYLSDCGYHTVFLSPLHYSFVNEGRFMESIGFETFIDQHDMKAPSTQESDSFYYNNALSVLKEHRQNDDRPVFMFVLTMSAHSPWNYRMEPDRTVAGEPFSTDSEINEYFRRLAISREDLEEFTNQVEALSQPTVVLEFGDHQPGLTLDYWRRREGPAPLANKESGAYMTSFQVQPLKTDLAAPVPSFERLDLQFLGVTLLEIAGIPLTPIQADLRNMRDECMGLFQSCGVEGRLNAHYDCRANQSSCSDARVEHSLSGAHKREYVQAETARVD
ncbi:sulfatase-like hydrolase/transferase [uncultured Roseibium sp.]|uniref:sulfatase-like hydrolase/transferase n=1 Tax=uncultured Roseibium sp. TaxID=1936171 RepID=UPI00261A2078|nr:sulfatase-like hydrolase/transferase [uncultured Roseibium sp.]